MLKLLEYINKHENWEEELQKYPYNLIIKRDGEYILFYYNQYDSVFSNDIVRECRGLILYEPTMTPVCVPFFKFANYGEDYADKLDWNTVHVQEKVDGSLMKVWFHAGVWHVSTSKNIDAYAALASSCRYGSFGGMFDAAAVNVGLDIEKLSPDYTYMFELVSPYNRIVVEYPETTLYFLGARNMETLQEEQLDIGVQKPKNYDLHSLEDCIAAAKELTYNEEGYVAVDANWKRNKIKSPQYIAASHLKNNGVVNNRMLIEMCKSGEISEFLSYFPEYKENYNDFVEKYQCAILDLTEDALRAWKTYIFDADRDRSEFGKIISKDKGNRAFMFALIDGKTNGAIEWFWDHTPEKIEEMIS